jgi:hypothetical protein
MSHGHDAGPTQATAEELANASHADLEYLVNPAGAEYEHTDASVWAIVKFGLWLIVSAVVIHFGMGLMYWMLQKQATVQQQEAGQQYPLAVSIEPRQPPAPRLQQFPRNEMYDLRRDQDQKLHSYGWVNKDAGTVHIPIDDAMKLMVQKGLLEARPADPALPPMPWSQMPSDSSSGRVMERRRQ